MPLVNVLNKKVSRGEPSPKLGKMPLHGVLGLGHVISNRGIEVDRAKMEVIERLPPPTNVKGMRSFLGHAGFDRRFIKDFSKVSKPLTQLLLKDAPFSFTNDCLLAFEQFKEALISAPIIPRLESSF